MAVTGSALLDFVIGFAVSVIASVMNAAGLNLLKLDHVRNSAQPAERQRNECGRPLWHIGLYLYIASQLAGSTIALNFLKTQWVAPLGSIALIFNFVFAKMLVGTQITRQDVYGTVVVMASVIWIVVFGGMNTSGDIEENLTLTDLKELFAKVVFVIYFSILNAIIFMFLGLGMYAYWAISLDDESGQMRKNMKTKLTRLLGTNRFARASGLTLEGDEGLEAEARDQRLKKVVAMIMSACGGLLASETLLLAKSGVKLITSTLAGQNQFTDNLSYFILFILVFTAILQVYCLNTGLKLYDSVLVVPTFYGFYTAFGLINSTIYLDQLGDYEPWVLLLVLVGIGALIYGVKMLSAPKPEKNPAGGPLSSLENDYDDDDDLHNSHEMEQRSKGGNDAGSTDGPTRANGSKSLRLSLKKKKSTSRRQSHLSTRLDEESDGTSLYGSRRAMMDSDSEISSTVGDNSMGMNSVGGSSVHRGRGMSFTSKSSFQSDPFRTPKDSRSINEGYIGAGLAAISMGAVAVATGGHQKSRLGPFEDEAEAAPTHVLVDTTEDLNDSEDEGQEREQEHRRQSMLQSSLNTLTMHEKRESVHGQDTRQQQQQSQQHPRIDTAVVKAKRESARFSSSSLSSPALMSPSRFRAQYTNSAMPPKPKHLQGQEESDDLGMMPRGDTDPAFNDAAGSSSSALLMKGHSVRWSTGSSKVDQAFEDLNPFKTIRSNRDSMAGAPAQLASVSSSLPSSPNPASSSSSRPGQHGRQDSFTGLPSEWDVPGRKKRHSMLFGETGRSNSASGGLVSSSSSSSSSTSPSPSPSSTPSGTFTSTSASTVTRTSSIGRYNHVSSPRTFATGESTRSRAEADMDSDKLEVTPSPRTSRIMSSPEIQVGGLLNTFALGSSAIENSSSGSASNS
ncbi:hypothetical protein BG011_009507 [Mortierella polycephala]|uniref:DUF803-domain-containing protein n=1 Tax=Mortierella polycephala TaxID=41804 RepID=A0A9P6TW77_9FUNG|nr:hypothetical protein BG011_009507 [Mortierella polycephala]